MKTGVCFLCGKTREVFKAGIALSMGGYDYSLCLYCLKNMTALEFWKRIFHDQDCGWPPKEITRKT